MQVQYLKAMLDVPTYSLYSRWQGHVLRQLPGNEAGHPGVSEEIQPPQRQVAQFGRYRAGQVIIVEIQMEQVGVAAEVGLHPGNGQFAGDGTGEVVVAQGQNSQIGRDTQLRRDVPGQLVLVLCGRCLPVVPEDEVRQLWGRQMAQHRRDRAVQTHTPHYDLVCPEGRVVESLVNSIPGSDRRIRRPVQVSRRAFQGVPRRQQHVAVPHQFLRRRGVGCGGEQRGVGG